MNTTTEQQKKTWIWLSFSYDGKNQGVCIVEANNIGEAMENSSELIEDVKSDDIQSYILKDIEENLELKPNRFYTANEMRNLQYKSSKEIEMELKDEKPKNPTIENLGTYYGYPKCCIESFDKTGGALNNPKGAKVGENKGFIPCPSCADKVLEGTIKLKDLIKDRVCSYPFPTP